VPPGALLVHDRRSALAVSHLEDARSRYELDAVPEQDLDGDGGHVVVMQWKEPRPALEQGDLGVDAQQRRAEDLVCAGVDQRTS